MDHWKFNIKSKFEKANLPVRFPKNPPNSGLLRNNQDIVQLAIQGTDSDGTQEYFELYRGAEENQVFVVNLNKKHEELILRVHEPEREYQERVWENGISHIKTRVTPSEARTYLLGRDETHLFLSRVSNNVHTVEQAHRSLKPSIVRERQQETNRIKRQGEWFFIPTTSSEVEMIKYHLRNVTKVVIRKWEPLSSSGTPHIAEKLVRIEGNTYVTGKIRHAEHHTIEFHGWFLAVSNGGGRTSSRRSNWVD